MKRIFLVDGAAGTGKTDLLQIARNDLRGSVGVVKKYTTRPLREVERHKEKLLDLNFVTDRWASDLKLRPDQYYEYSYPRAGGHRYFILRSDIDQALEEFDSIFLIVRSGKIIQKIQADYFECEVIPLFVYTVEDAIRQRMQKENYSRSEIEYRLSRSHEAMTDYYDYPTLYRATIVNNSDMRTYRKTIIETHAKFTKGDDAYLEITNQDRPYLPTRLRPYRQAIHNRLEKFPYQKNIFVMMAFHRSADNYFSVLNLTLRNKGYNAVRADDPYWNIANDDIINPYAVLFCCKYGIALFGAEQPAKSYNVNVSIEAGVMMLQDKRCLILKHKDLSAPPFDLASKIYDEFERDGDLIAKVEKWLIGL